jgi:hypothetical protein
LYFINKTTVTHLLATIVLIWGCSAYCDEKPVLLTDKEPTSHVIHYQEGVSRDFTYINFNHNPLPYIHEGEDGGEHIRFINVLGFAGDKFTVAVTAINGDVYDIISGEGVDVTVVESTGIESATADSSTINGGKDTEKTSLYAVTVIYREALFAVELSAHPYAEYRLVIKKL